MSWDDNFSEHPKNANRQSKRGRSSGGTTLFVKNKFHSYGNIKKQDAYHVIYKLDKNLFPALDKTLYICFLYISPNDSQWLQSGGSYNFEKLMSNIAKYEGMGGEVIILDDMNRRIANENDFIENNEENCNDDYLPIPEDFDYDNPIKKRNTLDTDVVSGHGKDVISFCRSTGFRIVNGRLGDDQNIGNFTCYTPADSSLVDYCLLRERNFELIKHFYVCEINTISDHSYLQLHLKIKNKTRNEPTFEPTNSEFMNDIDPCLTNLKEEYNCKYICHENSEQLIKNCLSTSEIRNELERLKLSITDDNMTVDNTIDELRNICINISDKSFTRIPFAKSKHTKKASRHQEWFDNDCKKAKQEINEKRKSYQEALRGNFCDSETKSRKNCYFQALKNFNAVKRRKERSYWKQKKELLGISKVKNPKEF